MSPATADQIIVEWIRDAFPLEGSAGTHTLSRVTDWDCILRSAEENAVAPLVYASLKKRGRENELPADVLERLRIAYLRSDTANWLALQELQSLLAQFERAQIPVVVLKGGALVTTLYPEPGLRPMSDLDLLIPRAQFAQANALLIGRDYVSPVELGEDFGTALTNYRAYERLGKNPAHIELHWHLFKSPYYCQRVPIEWFWERTTAATIHSQRARVFALEAQFLHLNTHFALHHRAARLIWSYDLALVLARERTRMNWDVVLDAAERFGLIPPLRLAVARATRTWGVSIPPETLARLDASRPGWQDRAAFAMMTARRGEARFLLDALGQPSLGLTTRFVWNHLFPARAYLIERYHICNERLVPLFYVWRFLDAILKFFRSALSTIAQD